MSYKCLDKDIYEKFMSFIQKDIEKRFGYESSYIEDYDDKTTENHFHKVYYKITCFYGLDRDVFPIYGFDIDGYFEDFKGLYRQLQIDKLF